MTYQKFTEIEVQENFLRAITRHAIFGHCIGDTASSAYSPFIRLVTSRCFRSLGNVTVYVTIGYAFISYALDR